jgi:hypothetical protein
MVRDTFDHILILVLQGFSLFKILPFQHEDLILLLHPPVFVFPLLFVVLHQLRKYFVLVRFVVRHVHIEREIRRTFIILGMFDMVVCAGKEISFDYFSEIL